MNSMRNLAAVNVKRILRKGGMQENEKRPMSQPLKIFIECHTEGEERPKDLSLWYQ